MDSSGGLAEVADPTATISPRVLVLPLYDPQKEAIAQQGGPNSDDLEIVNFIGFFYTSLDTLPYKQVHGMIVKEAGVNVETNGSKTVSLDSAFLTTIQLIR